MNRMNPRLWGVLAASVVASLALTATAGAVTPGAVYDATPNPLPPNVASLGFQATSTSEFGDRVHLGGTSRVLDQITVTMSDWALKSDYPTVGTSTSWQHPITVTVYSTSLAVLATTTQSITIPWRPAADPTCPGGTAWRASDTLCYNGIAFNATFDLPNVTLPNEVIVGIAYNTQSYGASPIGVAGPYNSLNVGVPTGQTASVGTDDNANNVYWNTSHGPFYSDLGLGGTGTFREDTNWAPNGTVAFRITTLAAPTSKDQCKNGGWMYFNNPSFQNQGGCVSYVQENQ